MDDQACRRTTVEALPVEIDFSSAGHAYGRLCAHTAAGRLYAATAAGRLYAATAA